MFSTNDSEIRQYRNGDEKQILVLFKNTFNESKDIKIWKWQFQENLCGPGMIHVLVNKSEIVAEHAIMRANINFNGTNIKAGQECDAMVSPAFRGQGVYTSLGSNNYERARNEGIKLVFAFPSRNSFPGSYPLLIRKQGFKRITNLMYFYKKPGLGLRWGSPVAKFLLLIHGMSANLFCKFLYGKIGQRIHIESLDALPLDSEQVFRQNRDYDVLGIWKDAEFIKWRYEKHPCHKYKFHILKVNGITECIVITRDDMPAIAICEVFHRRKDAYQTGVLLRYLCTYYWRSSARRLEFYGFDNGFFETSFRHAEFEIDSYSRIIFVVKVLGDEALDKYSVIPENWSISYGDTDSI